MKKRSSIIFSILVAFIAMILLSCSSVTNNLVEIDNIIYHECDGYYVADGSLKKNEDLYDAIIPEKINGKYVKEISDNAFDDCHYLVNVSIPSGVITIGEWAFASCWRLNNITIPSGVTTIGRSAFGWTNLEEIIIPSSVENDDSGLFSGCINTIIPNTVTSIVNYAFEYSDLEKIIIPANITSIGKYAFYSCDELEDVYYLGTLEQWNSFNLEEGNDDLISATCYIYSETQPTDITGLYWHYADGVPTKW